MKAQRTIVIMAAAGAVLALCPSAYFNVAPNIERAASDASMRGMVAVQVFCVIFLAIIPFVRHLFSRNGHTALTIALVVFNAMVAFQTANHRHDTDTGASNTAIVQSKAIDAELVKLRDQRAKLGDFKPAKQPQADAIQRALDEATKEKRNCWKHCEAHEKAVTDTQAKLDDMLARVTNTDEAAKLDEKIGKLEAKRLALGYVPEHADQSSARLASLIPFASEEDVAKGWILFQASMIEILNRFGPASMFAFIMGLGATPNTNREIVWPKGEPLPQTPLAAVPHLPVAEPVPVATVIEADQDKPAPLPPSGAGRERTVSKRKPEKKATARASRTDNVIPFRKDVIDEVHALLSSRKTQREVAALLGIGERTVRRMVAASKNGQVAALARGQMAAF